jgi:hypothetical protein
MIAGLPSHRLTHNVVPLPVTDLQPQSLPLATPLRYFAASQTRANKGACAACARSFKDNYI